MNETSVTAAFQDWWTQSYKRPPAQLGIATHVGFAMHILKFVEMAKDENGQSVEGQG